MLHEIFTCALIVFVRTEIKLKLIKPDTTGFVCSWRVRKFFFHLYTVIERIRELCTFIYDVVKTTFTMHCHFLIGMALFFINMEDYRESTIP